MFSKLLLASVAAIGLLLAGPQKASAQVIYACVNSIGNIVAVAGPNAPCPPNVGSATWTKTTLSQTPGVLAGRAFQCDFPQTVVPTGAISFVPSLSGVNFGSGISTPTGAGPWVTFLLQPGIYSINFSAEFSPVPTDISASQGTLPVMDTWYPFGSIFVGERLISVSQPNTNLFLFQNSPSKRLLMAALFFG